MTSAKSKGIVQIICSFFIFLFVYTALSKFLEFNRFEAVLGTSPLIGDRKAVVAWSLPSIELIVALLLLFPETKRLGLYSSLVLISVFTLYVGYMIVFAPHLPCSCGGIIQQFSWPQHFVFNLILTAMAAFAVFQYKIFVATDRGNRKPVTE